MDILFPPFPEAALPWQAMASFLSPLHFNHHTALYLVAAAVSYWKHSWLPLVYVAIALAAG